MLDTEYPIDDTTHEESAENARRVRGSVSPKAQYHGRTFRSWTDPTRGIFYWRTFLVDLAPAPVKGPQSKPPSWVTDAFPDRYITAPAEDLTVIQQWCQAIDDLGPFARAKDGRLYAQVWDPLAEAPRYEHYENYGELHEFSPNGIYEDAEVMAQRRLAERFPADWNISKSSNAMQYLRNLSQDTTELGGGLLIPAWNGVLDLDYDEYTDDDWIIHGAHYTSDQPLVRPYSDAYRFTSQIPVPYWPGMRSPEFREFLTGATDADTAQLIYEMIGYTCLASQPLKKAFLLYGPRDTGKSTLLNVVQAVIGAGACTSLGLKALTEDQFAIANLYGKLANVGADLDETYVKNTGTFKSLTSGDTVFGNQKYGGQFKFRSQATHWFASNNLPMSSDRSDAWHERWVVVPMLRRPDTPDLGLERRLTTPETLCSIFSEAVDAVHTTLRNKRFSLSQAAIDAHQDFILKTDPVQAFFLHANENYPVPVLSSADQLFAAYEAWAQQERVLRPLSRSRLLSQWEEWTRRA